MLWAEQTAAVVTVRAAIRAAADAKLRWVYMYFPLW